MIMMTADWDDVKDDLIFKATYPYKNTNPSLTCPALNHYNQGAKVITVMILWAIVSPSAGFCTKNIATGETSQAITPFHFFDNFNFHHKITFIKS